MEGLEKILGQVIEREKRAKIIFAQLNNFTDLEPTLMSVIVNIKELTGCEAVGIRLHNNGDYPYYVSTGFPSSFILKENSLCTKDKNGMRIVSPDSNGYLLECMCGNIIWGRFDPKLSFFTNQGSFWSNNTTKLLAETNEKDRQGDTRNHCNSCGYESVALIPIGAFGEIIGLIQLNDFRIGMFTEDLIEYLEMIAEHCALAVKNSLIFTEQKKIKEQLQSSLHEILIINKELDAFSQSLSIELQEPLRIIESYSKILLEEYSDKLGEEGEHCIERISESAGRSRSIMTDLLMYSRISRAKNAYESVESGKLLKEVLTRFQAIFKEKNVDLEIDDNLPFIYCDAEKMKVVFYSLISNAVKFNILSVIKIEIGSFNKDGEQIFYIKDNGIGIKEDYYGLIFEIFKRLHPPKMFGGGNGSGLAVVKKVIEEHNGRIWVESKENIGTTFFFTILQGRD